MIKALRNFLTRTQGAVAIEAALMLPVLMAMMVVGVTFYDGFRHYTGSVRASNTIADSISRIQAVLTPEDIEGLHRTFQYMTRQAEGTSLRVSQFKRVGTEVSLDWSYGTGGLAGLTPQNAGFVRNRLPPLPDGSHIVLVETYFQYEPTMGFDLPNMEFENFMPIRPRFGDRMIFSGMPSPPYCRSNCGASEGYGLNVIQPSANQTPAWDTP
ncbi:hypothetical protein OE810_12725 [Rhodobacteraceae bacterium XHP0102]|nr:hypothetical protein [Rhodobacteraceae bacterium XHP0102]